MTPVTCRYCGLPFKVHRVTPAAEHFCCTGCAMLAHVPVDAEGRFPVNAHLISALIAGFLYFNELLFWALATLLSRDAAQVALAARFGWLAAIAAFLVWLTVLIIQLREKTGRTGDLFVAIFALVLHGAAFSLLPPSAACMAAANAGLILWSIRGLFRPKKNRSV